MYAIPRLFTLLFLAILASGCERNPEPPASTVDLAQARLNDFKLAEVNYADIDISHPVLTDGSETTRGAIRVLIPRGTTGLRLTPKPSSFSSDDFTISPALGTVYNFSGGPVTFTLRSKTDASKMVHYDVTITEEEPPAPPAPVVTAFTFEKSRNAALSADVAASSIAEGVATLGKIYVFVPVGTDFSQLTPTIEHEGGTLYYSQDPNSAPESVTTTYPASGTRIDFAWPKRFYAIVKGASSVAVYEVFVDVRNPIKFDQAAVTTANVSKGAIRFLQGVTRYTNQGNHPITLLAVDHSGQEPAGTNAVRGSSAVPAQGLNPGQSAEVNVTISAQTWPPGTYGVTASFRPGIYNQAEANTLLEPSTLTLTTTIVD